MTFTKGKISRLSDGIHPDDYDFDHPNSLDFNDMYRCLLELIEGNQTKTPVYCFKVHKRLLGQHKVLLSKDIIIFEGILCMHDERIRKLFDLKIFIHCDPDIALARRIRRDINERGRDVTEVLKRYNRFVKRDFDKYVKPQMKYVDFTIPGGANNDVAMDILVQNLNNRLKLKTNKNSITLSLEDQFRDLLYTDFSKIASSAQLQCLAVNYKYLNNMYLALVQAENIHFAKSSVEGLVDMLIKNTLSLIGEDLKQPLEIPLAKGYQIYCKNYITAKVENTEQKLRCQLFCETVCSVQTATAIIEQYKGHKGVPVYGAFLFIEKEAIEILYKEIDLLKVICLFSSYSISKIRNLQQLCPSIVLIDVLSDLGDNYIKEKFAL